MDDPSTSASEGFGLIFYSARWLDPVTGRFAQADTIVPGGVQGYDRYAYGSNNPIRYIDPSGHMPSEGCGDDGKSKCAADPSTGEAEKNLHHIVELETRVYEQKCAAGNKAYCPTPENIPLIFASGIAVAYFGYTAIPVTINAAYATIVTLLANIFTHNPEALNVSLGNYGGGGNGYTGVGDNFVMTYLSTGSEWVYNSLVKIGMWQDINNEFMMTQMEQGKTFFVTELGALGSGTINEIGLAVANGYNDIQSIWSQFSHILVP